MTTTKKNYVKPQMTVIDVEPQMMICVSGGDTIMYDLQSVPENEDWTGEFY